MVFIFIYIHRIFSTNLNIELERPPSSNLSRCHQPASPTTISLTRRGMSALLHLTFPLAFTEFISNVTKHMQCSWQTLARLSVVNRLYNIVQPSIRSIRGSIGPFFSKRTFSTSTNIAWSFTNSTIRRHNPRKPILLESEITLTGLGLAEDGKKTFTSTERARAATQAVHICLRAGNLSDAYHIVNSIRYAGFGDDAKVLPGIKSFKKFEPIAHLFDKDVSPRLPSHALLHGLIRLNQFDQASTLAGQMMSAGIPVSCRTLEAIFRCIKENSDHDANSRRPYMPKELLESSDVLSLRPSMLSDRGTKFAIDLLMVARRSRQQRSKKMFRILMALCIINGEIIVASLLIGILVRDWQARELTGGIKPENNKNIFECPKTPCPEYTHLEEICSTVTRALASDKSDRNSQFAFKASLQALANLATMLNHQTITYHNISPLLTALYKCPRVPDMVWVYDHSGNPELVVAYKYFHKVLHRFMLSLPTHPPTKDERKKLLPPLNIYSYNCLLHYALRHRNSTALAEGVLHHMIHERYQPLNPDTTTLNIIARSGTLLRDSEIADIAFSKLKGSSDSLMPAPSAKKSSLTPSPLRSLLTTKEQKNDKYALAARIAHLTATGQPNAVVDLLPILFPTLTLPENRQYSDYEKVELHEEHLRRSMLLGPVVFTSFLNALQKAGRTGLAEKVWERAKLLERMSWTVEVNGRLQPWCLPVLAYTIMIKVYAEEAKKGHFYGKEVDRTIPISIQKPLPLVRHVRIKGWGSPGSNTDVPRTRSAMGRHLGMCMYRSMRYSAEDIRLEISKLQHQNIPIYVSKRELEVPEPDARFFNAILDIVGRHPHEPPRKVRQGPGHYRRQYRKRYLDYVWRGIQVKPPNPYLLEVGKDMKAAGFEIPLLFQKFFVGMPEDDGPLDRLKPRLERDRRVFAAKKAWSPREQVGKIMIPVQNTRTLDLSGRRWLRRRRPGLCRKLDQELTRKPTTKKS